MSDTKKSLYPLKFVPIPKEKVWGGHALAKDFNKPFDPAKLIGESWEIAGFEDDSSVIAEGFLKDNRLYDIIETYMDEIVGDDHYKQFGNEFPLLIKLLNIQDRLSVQVHPDDETAFDRHNCNGKTEAWYVLDADPEAVVYMGFNRDVDPNEFYERCQNETVEEVLNVIHPKKGDFFYVEAGIVHCAGGGLVIAEVQELSDATYRIYDWGREHNPETARPMHLDLAFDCINYKKYDESKYYIPAGNGATKLADNKYFTVHLLDLVNPMKVHPDTYESFIVYYCVDGTATVEYEGAGYSISKGEWMLIPASMKDFILSGAVEGTRILEMFTRRPAAVDSYTGEAETSQE